MEFTRGDTQPFKFKITDKDGKSISSENIKTLILTCRKYNLKSSAVLFDKNKEGVIQ